MGGGNHQETVDRDDITSAAVPTSISISIDDNDDDDDALSCSPSQGGT